MDLLKSPWLLLFLIVAAAHLATLGFQLGLAANITKCLLAPLLAIWVVQQDGPWLLVVALIGCFFGDLFLEFEADIWFLVGMGAFAVAQITFVVFFLKEGALDRLLNHWWVIPVLLVVAAGLLALVWTGLPTALRVAVPIYAVLLLSMGALAFSTDVHAGFGAALFIFSDALIALRVADVLPRESVVASLVVMSTYIAALFLLSIGIVGYDKASADSPSPAVASDSNTSSSNPPISTARGP